MAKHMFRLSVPAFLLGLILYPAGGLQALGLGEARVESWLGQPLDVTVGLLDVDRDEAESVRVVPASLADFERLGIPSEALGLGLEVEVDRRATPPQVRVRSRHSANDPIVRLLLDARWSSGRVLREYTLFLDPPTTPSAPPVVETGAKSSRPDAARPVADPIPSREAASRPARAQETEAGSSAPDDANGRLAGISDDFVAVASGDTLWSIAYDWRPSSSMSMDQVMLAIFNLNPDAFIDGNINNLRSSAQLEMPDVDDIESIGRASARHQVSEHMNRWQSAPVGEVPVVSEAALSDTPDPVPESEHEADTSSSRGQSDVAAASEDDYRLDVVPPDEDGFSEGTAVAEDELDQVADTLAELKEEAAAEGLDGEAFDDHASEIRTALDQRDMAGLAVAEESLAELQARLREMREARALEEEAVEPDVAGSDDMVADYMRELEDEFDISSGDQLAQVEAEADSDEPADDEEVAGQPAAGQPMSVTKTSTSSSDSGGLPGWLWPIAGLVLILVVVIVLLRRRRSEAFSSLDGMDRALPPEEGDSSDLSGHLDRLNRLADEGRDDEFVDAFDQMYQQVDDESAPEWQEALLLAQAHAPDHPLLTPPEMSAPDSEELAEAPDSIEPEPAYPDAEFDSPAPDAAGGDEFDVDKAPEEGVSEEGFDAVDMGILSGRVDESGRDVRDSALTESDPESDDQDLDGFREPEPRQAHWTGAQEPDDHEHKTSNHEPDEPEHEGRAFDEDSGLDLDFDWAESAPEEESPQTGPDHEPARQDAGDDPFSADFAIEAGDDAAETPQADDEADEWLEEWEADDAPSLQDLAEDLELSAEEPGEGEPDEGHLDVDGGDLSEDGLGLDFSDLEMSTELPDEAETADADDAGAEFGELLETPDVEPSQSALSDEDCDIKLDLARAYISSGLMDSAVEVLEEVARDGSPEKAAEARRLLEENR